MTQNATLERPQTGQGASLELTHALTQTVYREARMLDDENYADWVDMLADDLLYHMPGIETRYRRDKTDQITDLTRMAYYNDNLTEIKKTAFAAGNRHGMVRGSGHALHAHHHQC